jgi:hypothetical protein
VREQFHKPAVYLRTAIRKMGILCSPSPESPRYQFFGGVKMAICHPLVEFLSIFDIVIAQHTVDIAFQQQIISVDIEKG